MTRSCDISIALHIVLPPQVATGRNIISGNKMENFDGKTLMN